MTNVKQAFNKNNMAAGSAFVGKNVMSAVIMLVVFEGWQWFKNRRAFNAAARAKDQPHTAPGATTTAAQG